MHSQVRGCSPGSIFIEWSGSAFSFLHDLIIIGLKGRPRPKILERRNRWGICCCLSHYRSLSIHQLLLWWWLLLLGMGYWGIWILCPLHSLVRWSNNRLLRWGGFNISRNDSVSNKVNQFLCHRSWGDIASVGHCGGISGRTWHVDAFSLGRGLWLTLLRECDFVEGNLWHPLLNRVRLHLRGRIDFPLLGFGLNR